MTWWQEVITAALKPEEGVAKIDPTEIKKISDGLNSKEEVTSKDFKEVLEKNSEAMGKWIINYFDWNLKTLTENEGTKTAYNNTIKFLLEKNPNLDLKIKNDLQLISNDLVPSTVVTSYWRLRKQYTEAGKADKDNKTKTQEEFMKLIFEQTKTVENILLEKTFSAEIKEKRIEELTKDFDDADKANAIYMGITKALIAKRYPKEMTDAWFIEDLSKITLSNADKTEIKAYVTNTTNNTAEKVKNFYNKNYSAIALPITIDWDLKSIVIDLRTEEVNYKKEQLKTSMKTSVNAQLSEYDFSEDTKKAIETELYGKIDAKIKKYDDKEVISNYSKKDIDNASFKKDITSVLNEAVAEQNRAYLLDKFNDVKSVTYTLKWDELAEAKKTDKNAKEKTIIIDQAEKDHFEKMLDETSAENINTLALATTYPGQLPKMLEELWKQVKDKGEEKNSISFKNAKIVSATTSEEVDKIEASLDSKWTYTTQLEKTKTNNSIETSKANITAQLDVYLKSPYTKEVTVQVPTWNNEVRLQMEEIIKQSKELNPNAVTVKLDEVNGLNNIKIKSIEEVPGEIALKLEKLSYNVIWDKTKIEAALKAADPKMSEILDNDDYKITRGDIYGSASFQRTPYVTKPWLEYQKYKDIVNVTNKTMSGNGDINNTAINTTTPQVDQWYDGGLWTNNPTLAYDRATSFLDYFYGKEGKVSDWANFDLSYGVNWPSKKDLLSKHPEITDENAQAAQLENLFKEWQYAKIHLDFTKKTNNEKEFPIDSKELATWFTINIIGEPSKTTHPSKGRDLWGWLFKWGNNKSKKPDFIHCPRFD